MGEASKKKKLCIKKKNTFASNKNPERREGRKEGRKQGCRKGRKEGRKEEGTTEIFRVAS